MIKSILYTFPLLLALVQAWSPNWGLYHWLGGAHDGQLQQQDNQIVLTHPHLSLCIRLTFQEQAHQVYNSYNASEYVIGLGQPLKMLFSDR